MLSLLLILLVQCYVIIEDKFNLWDNLLIEYDFYVLSKGKYLELNFYNLENYITISDFKKCLVFNFVKYIFKVTIIYE